MTTLSKEDDCNFEAQTCPEAFLQERIADLVAENERLKAEIKRLNDQVSFLSHHREIAEKEAKRYAGY